jgi:hypothetical protein
MLLGASAKAPCGRWRIRATARPAAVCAPCSFEDRAFRSRRSEERDDFFRTYGRLADTAAFAELARLLEQRQLVAVGWNAELRRGAALALGE